MLVTMLAIGSKASCRVIAARLGKVPSDITGRLDSLVVSGLVFYAGDAVSPLTNRVVMHYALTAKGIEAAKNASAIDSEFCELEARWSGAPLGFGVEALSA